MIRYAFQLALIAISIIGFFTFTNFLYKGFCLWTLGAFVGAIARDLGWLWRIKKAWPFTEKIIDWRIVKELAEGKKSADNKMQGTS